MKNDIGLGTVAGSPELCRRILRFYVAIAGCPVLNTRMPDVVILTTCSCSNCPTSIAIVVKYWKKYWLAVDKESKYMINGFSYVGKDELRCALRCAILMLYAILMLERMNCVVQMIVL